MIELRDYQRRSVEEVLRAFRAGYRSVCLVSPTGSGKRRLAMWFMEYAQEHGRRTLFLGNRRLLINQAANEAEEHGIDYGVIMADTMIGNPGASNQVASIHTLEARHFYESWTSELTGPGLPEFELGLIDEAHRDLDKYARLRSLRPQACWLGFTATPLGPDGRAIVPSPFEVLIEPVKNSELIRDEWLLSTKVFAPSEPYIDGVKIVKHEYNQKQLGRAVHECTVAADVFAEWEEKGGRQMATVVFVPGVAYGRDLERQFNFLLGPGQAHVIEAKTKPAERERVFDLLRGWKGRILISVDVLREGFDLPLLQCAIDLQPNQQLRSYWQKIGRIKRRFADQSFALSLDFAGNYHRFLHPDHDPSWPEGPEETSQEVIQRQRAEGKISQPIMCPKCSLVRDRGPTCPSCGHTNPQAIRRVRMGNGKLREIPAVAPPPPQKTEEQRLFGKWQRRLYAALYNQMTYGQAARLYHKDTGQYPRPGWVGVHETGSLDWKKRPSNHYTFAQLTRACALAKERMRS